MSQPPEYRAEAMRLIGLARDILSSAEGEELAIAYLDLGYQAMSVVPSSKPVDAKTAPAPSPD